jgi:hypothetical protein
MFTVSYADLHGLEGLGKTMKKTIKCSVQDKSVHSTFVGKRQGDQRGGIGSR